MWRRFIRIGVCSIILLHISVTGNAKRIVVSNQNDFENLSAAIGELLDNNESVDVVLRKGVYYYRNNQLLLNGIHRTGAKIRMEGKNAVLIPIKSDSSIITPYRSVLTNLKDVDLWSNMYASSEKVAIIDANSKLCRIRRSDSNVIGEGDYILITKWFTSGIYKINRVNDDYIFFTAIDTRFRDQYGEYDVNYDYIYDKSFPRYKLFPSKGSTNDCYVCDATTFLHLKDCSIGSLSMRGISFVGGSDNSAVVLFDGLNAESVNISKCRFIALRNTAISISGASNICINKCEFERCYTDVITADERCCSVTITNCKWNKCGLLLNNPSCIIMACQGYLIKNNLFVDFYGRALTLGVYYSKGETVHTYGEVVGNEFCFTLSFFENAEKELLKDNGAIYVNTINDNLIIRNNYIHDFVGAGDNRGVFLDDGARNVKVLGNVIVRVPKGHSISSRRVKTVERIAGLANVGNVIQENIFEGTVRFEGNEIETNGCTYGPNYVLLGEDIVPPMKQLLNISTKAEDIVIKYAGQKHCKITLNSNCKRILRKSQEWKGIKKYVLIKNWNKL